MGLTPENVHIKYISRGKNTRLYDVYIRFEGTLYHLVINRSKYNSFAQRRGGDFVEVDDQYDGETMTAIKALPVWNKTNVTAYALALKEQWVDLAHEVELKNIALTEAENKLLRAQQMVGPQD